MNKPMNASVNVVIKSSPLQKFMWKLQGLSDWSANNNIGKILTLLDASITDKDQNKALKDLVKQIIWDEEMEAHRSRNALVCKFINLNKLPLVPEDYMKDALKHYVGENGQSNPMPQFLDLESDIN